MLRWLSMDVTVLVLIFVFVLVILGGQQRAREQREKLRILEEAIRSGKLDPATQQDLVGELTGRRPGAAVSSTKGRGGLTRLTFAVGWLMLFLGVGLVALDDSDTLYGGIIVGALGFGLLSLPIALRELERDRDTARTSSRS